jgi:hypothetical protein
MLNSARQRLREDLAPGDSPAVVQDKVEKAGPTLGEEQQAVLWLYGWHHAGGDDACRSSAHRAHYPAHVQR